ncbi:MAG: VPLPA-CTERM sorting domain-containing protein [Gammaproteobacteria bacterium]|jgi:hypothetical protein|nr:VPLPA-CTERM sorting domain-containing protein [Gammaproteobacteria bacterium]
MRSSTVSIFSLYLALGTSGPALAATVSLYEGTQELVVRDTVAEARYRISNTNWDQMLGTGAAKPTARDMTTAGLGTAGELNGMQWDFKISYESGDDGARGFTFSMAQGDYRRAIDPGYPVARAAAVSQPYVSTLLFDAKHPLTDSGPLGAFNAINFETRAGALRDEMSKAMLEVTKVNFYAGKETTALKDLSAFSSSRNNEWSSYWTTSNKDLSSFDWTVSGIVQGRFACADGSTRCLSDESLKLNMRFAQVDTVPVPAAVWLFGFALGALALQRRRNRHH